MVQGRQDDTCLLVHIQLPMLPTLAIIYLPKVFWNYSPPYIDENVKENTDYGTWTAQPTPCNL